MQQTPNKQLTNLSSWAYFLGMGVAIGAGSIGTLLSVLLHNPPLGYTRRKHRYHWRYHHSPAYQSHP